MSAGATVNAHFNTVRRDREVAVLDGRRRQAFEVGGRSGDEELALDPGQP